MAALALCFTPLVLLDILDITDNDVEVGTDDTSIVNGRAFLSRCGVAISSISNCLLIIGCYMQSPKARIEYTAAAITSYRLPPHARPYRRHADGWKAVVPLHNSPFTLSSFIQMAHDGYGCYRSLLTFRVKHWILWGERCPISYFHPNPWVWSVEICAREALAGFLISCQKTARWSYPRSHRQGFRYRFAWRTLSNPSTSTSHLLETSE